MFIHSSQFCANYDEAAIQPNALDITIDSVSHFPRPDDVYPEFVLRKEGSAEKRFKATLEPINNVLFDLVPGQYEFESDTTVELPKGVCGWLVARSTLNRNGIFIVSGLYDAGFKGRVGGTIYVPVWSHFEKGARVAQLITARADTIHLYDGQYQKR